MVLDFTNMPKNKQQFDDFEQEEEIIKGKAESRGGQAERAGGQT